MLLHPLRRAAVALAVGSLALPSQAGDYHDGITLGCDQCHVMHPSAGQELQPSQSAGGLLESVRVGHLLREDVNDLCLTCHDESSRATDVLGANHGSNPRAVRQAGALNRLGISGFPATGHTLDSLDEAPGSRPAWKPEDENGTGKGLNCINCHAPHGEGGGWSTYRNLRSDAGWNEPGQGRVTYNDGRPGSLDPTRDIFVRRALDYDESAIDFNEPDPSDSAMARFCSGCHALFHEEVGPDTHNAVGQMTSALQAFVRHPSSGVDVGARGGEGSSLARLASRENRVKLMSGSASWGRVGGDVTPTCISCHKAHGNANAFGLILRSGRGRLTEEGDSGGRTLESLCGQCHVQGTEL